MISTTNGTDVHKIGSWNCISRETEMKIAVQLLVIYWNYTLIRSNVASVRLWDNPVLEGTIVCAIFHFASQWVLAEKCSEQCSLFAHSWHDYKVLHTWHFLWSPWLWCLHGRFTVGLWDWNSLNWNTNHTVHIHRAVMLHCKTVHCIPQNTRHEMLSCGISFPLLAWLWYIEHRHNQLATT